MFTFRVGKYAKDKIEDMKSQQKAQDHHELPIPETESSPEIVIKPKLKPLQIGSPKNHGFCLGFQQFWALIVKKAMYYYRNPLFIAAQMLIPVLIVHVTMVMLHSIPRDRESPNLHMWLDEFSDPLIKYFYALPSDELALDYEKGLLPHVRGPERIIRKRNSVNIKDSNGFFHQETMASIRKPFCPLF